MTNTMRANLAQAAFTCDLYQQREAANACREALDTDRLVRVLSHHVPDDNCDYCECGWQAPNVVWRESPHHALFWALHIANELTN